MIIYLKPRGEPEPFASWDNPNPRPIEVTKEDENYWYGVPVNNPACSELQYPKFAWEQVDATTKL